MLLKNPFILFLMNDFTWMKAMNKFIVHAGVSPQPKETLR